MIIISGASRGIGRFLLEKYLDQNEDVYGSYMSTIPLQDKYFSSYSKVDVNDEISVQQWVKSIDLNNQEITLINCAGTNYNSFAHKADINKWRHVIETNLFGTFNMIRELLPVMRTNNFGRIINLSSIVAQKGVPGTSAYAASKSALWGLAKSISVENASKNITINNLNLGYFGIGMINDIPVDIQEAIKNMIPGGSFGEPSEILDVVKVIIKSSYITGTSIDINGGIY